MPSIRSRLVSKRTYNRVKEDETQETMKETIDRAIAHQEFLWDRASKGKVNREELNELRELWYRYEGFPAGRTLFLGNVAGVPEASQFNCAFSEFGTIRDGVDIFHLLLQGCGVGSIPKSGMLNGFSTKIPSLRCIPSTRKTRGREDNCESYNKGIWTIKIGDSASAWSKSFGKILAGKYPGCKELVLDFTEIRPEGTRLTKYGWISAGYKPLEKAFQRIFQIMNSKAGCLLSHMDLLDMMNLLGTVLSSRRSAQILLYPHHIPGWLEFATAKRNFWENDNHHRQQSNNSLIFWSKPSRKELRELFQLIVENGGSEPGFLNAMACLQRAPWFKGVNPCVEILLLNKGFCNLCETDLGKFYGRDADLQRALYLQARANYRQTVVNLRDGILQEEWHQNNEFLRLCGVSVTGIAKRPDLTTYQIKQMRNAAIHGAYSMAGDLGLQLPKNVTCIKPSGTLSKVMDTTEGIHIPLGRHLINNINFSKYDPLVSNLQRANYTVRENPSDPTGVLVSIPVDNGAAIPVYNTESAITQLNRYKFWMDHWCDQNVSCTIYYSQDEIEDIVDWLDKEENWNSYCGVSFLPRQDPTKTAKDLGYLYLPQEVITKEQYDEYCKSLKEVNFDGTDSSDEISVEDCPSGVCPVR